MLQTLPEDMERLLALATSVPQDCYWIAKPRQAGGGRHIFLLTSNEIQSRLAKAKEVVVQRYIRNPLLIDGYKVDLRVYVAVTPCKKVFLYREGSAHVC
jgi:hypothetical protein